MFTLAHVTDWHATDPRGAGVRPLLGKRFFGWLSWTLRRGRLHRPEVLSALFRDLKEQQPDHVAVTGDLTNIGLPREFAEAAGQLEALGEPSRVSVIPGNHDAYVRIRPEISWDLWAPYMVSDENPADRAPAWADYPTLRIRDRVALVGACSAIPTPWFQASGKLGARQLERLDGLLRDLRARDLFRVVLIHHPPVDTETSGRRRLRDSKALTDVLARCGAELVLHGHRHRTRIGELPGPDGPIPVVGARSSSDVGEQEEKRAQYHLYRIEFGPARQRPTLRLSVRGWDPVGERFVAEQERSL
jgi:3',5'-cyclic AMP phosphodiesterase CpdA